MGVSPFNLNCHTVYCFEDLYHLSAEPGPSFARNTYPLVHLRARVPTSTWLRAEGGSSGDDPVDNIFCAGK
jgi:hypothetical protein